MKERFPGKKNLVYAKWNNCNKVGNEALEVCLFCMYFELSIFHYSVGMEVCIGAHMHVFMYLFTACYADSYELGEKS